MLGMVDVSITSVGEAVPGDLFSVSGTGFEPGMTFTFSREEVVLTVSPEFVRPHLAVLAKLPENLAEGGWSLTAVLGEGRSAAFPVEVSAAPAPMVRVLNAGAAKALPYTIVFAANPVCRKESGELVRDLIMADRFLYQATVVRCLDNLFSVGEDLLRAGGIDAQMKLVSVFDGEAEIEDRNCLAAEVVAHYTETMRENLPAFLAGRGITADVVFVIFDSKRHASASAWPTTDDAGKAGLIFSIDGEEQTHGCYPRIPGSAAIPVTFQSRGITVLHEFGHAASAFDNGWITDLYVDGEPSRLFINKKWRDDPADPIPPQFGAYDTRVYDSARDRGARAYSVDWKSYHPELTQAECPNVMDDYWRTDDPHQCRFDRLTYRWLSDRLAAKLQRE